MILSIIIPVYNIESYLCQCINSLLCDNKNYEIILVDDGSTDNSPQICDDFAQKYEFIHSFHKQNGGVSSARNYGLRKAVGEYIYFVDGDDWISGFQNIFNFLVDAELIGVNYDRITDDGQILFTHHCTCDTIAVNDYPLYYERHFHALWGFIFKRDIIDSLNLKLCEDLAYAEDWVFVVNYLSHIKEIKMIHNAIYKYRIGRKGSAMSKKYNASQVLLHFKALDLINSITPIRENKKYYNNEYIECFSYVLNIVRHNALILKGYRVHKLIKQQCSLKILMLHNLKLIIKIMFVYIKFLFIK